MKSGCRLDRKNERGEHALPILPFWAVQVTLGDYGAMNDEALVHAPTFPALSTALTLQ